MIPNRMPGNEFFGNGLKLRVTACRKRLRVNRYQHRAQSDVAQSVLAPDLNAKESLVGVDEGSEQCAGWIRPEQEIGIT